MPNKLLIVDDEPAILRSLARVFAREGYNVFTAESGNAALAIMQLEACQVVISDFRMPIMDGAALLAEIKILYPASLCIVLSGFADFNAVLALLNSGSAFRFLQKPWDETTLLVEVAEAFRTYDETRDEKIITQLMASSADGLVEVFAGGQLGRVNGIAKNLLKLNDVNHSTFVELFSPVSDDGVAHLLDSPTGHAVLKTVAGREIEAFVKIVYEHSRVLQVLLVDDAEPVFSSHLNLPAVLDQKSILRSADVHLQAGTPFAMVAIQLKNYGFWSEMVGFSEAEALFEDISAVLLKQASKISALMGYLANEQFVLLLDNISAELDVHAKLAALIEPFGPLNYTKSAVRVEFVITYCMAPEDGQSGRQLLNNVLISNRLHANGQANFFMRYDASMIERKRSQLLISEALFYAIDNEQLFLHYQPKFDLKQRKICSCEVLLRWQHPSLGFVSPAVFIPIAEQEGQIVELGYWVLQRACMAISNWSKQGVQLDKVAINISGKQLAQDDFIPRVETLLAGFDIDTSLLEFELTETWLIENLEQSIEKLSRLKKAGVSIAIDDFGTGYSSLSYLSKLPIDVIKIDRSLIIDIAQNLNTQSMVANITRMAHDMSMQVVVEGVETLEQLKMLEQLNCDVIQGFLIAKPQSEQSFINFVGIAGAGLASLMGDQ